jgi:two-component system, sensor histidine kinase and response regulator
MAHILLIEDTIALRQETAEILRFEGHDVTTAEHGGIGIARAEECPPDLVISDLMMPEVDGYETLAAFRANPKLATIPFVCLTARSERQSMRRAMELGADDFLSKPFSASELMAAVDAGLAKQARARSDADGKLADLRARITLSLPHEMRTPLTAILGYSELMQDPITAGQPAEVQAMADRIRLSALRLSRLTENFLLLAQLELVARDPHELARLGLQGRADTRAVWQSVMATRIVDTGRSADVRAEIEPAEVGLTGDCCAKIVAEIVDNAIKFSAPGSPVEVTVTAAEEWVVVTVSDHGRGMSEADSDRIGAYMQFERRLYEQQGLGVGLAIARRLTELGGGAMHIRSEVGVGTTVRIELPRAGAPAARAASA